MRAQKLPCPLSELTTCTARNRGQQTFFPSPFQVLEHGTGAPANHIGESTRHVRLTFLNEVDVDRAQIRQILQRHPVTVDEPAELPLSSGQHALVDTVSPVHVPTGTMPPLIRCCLEINLP